MDTSQNTSNASDLETEIKSLRVQLSEREHELVTLKLSNDSIARFSRQIILPEVRVTGQLSLKRASVLIVGAGGLGCPCALYLAGAGVGRIGVVDYDVVEINNLHRQLLHKENSLGMKKVDSVKRSLKELNSKLIVDTHNVQITSRNAPGIVEDYDLVVDCTDNVATRYLLNDCCVLAKKPLISGSAIKWEGQLTVYNFQGGPCYRCLFPVPPPPETILNCGDGGVMGAVTGVIGSLQALEVIKIILNQGKVLSGRLLLFDALDSSFRNVALRAKKPNCEVCSTQATIKELIDYEGFCGMPATDKGRQLKLLKPSDRITVQELKRMHDAREQYTLIDVRSEQEFEICQLPDAQNIDIEAIMNNKGVHNLETQKPIFVICRRGNDSQKAVKHLQVVLRGADIKDVIGGLHAWTKEIDANFPIY